MADIKADFGSVTEMGSTLKSPNRGLERTKYVPQLIGPLVYKSVYFSATTVPPTAITNHQICPYTWLHALFQRFLDTADNFIVSLLNTGYYLPVAPQ
jgi:hypothetical protein